MNKKRSYDIISVGEILWDSLPSGLFLGGAPLNVCLHANELGMSTGIISRVGNDKLGNEAVRRIRIAGVDTSLIQLDEAYETGFVEVELDKDGDPQYKITEDVAWDFIRYTDALEQKTNSSRVLVYGSLALRSAVSRKSIIELLKNTSALPVIDLNLRYPHYSKKLVSRLLSLAEVIKLNREELQILTDWFSFSADIKEAMKQVAEKFTCKLVTMTDGGRGAYLWQEGSLFWQESYDISVKDAVGAGDAYLAALLYGVLNDYPAEDALQLANAAGAFVAGKSGATPAYNLQDLKKFKA